MAEFDMFNFENKLRIMVQELIAPTIRRTIEVHDIVEKLQRSDHEHSEKLMSLEYGLTRVTNKLPMIDDLYKCTQDLSAFNRNNEALINLKTESIMGQLELVNQETRNLTEMCKMNEDSISAVKVDFAQHIESINGLKDALLYENSILSKKLEKTRMEAKEIWDIISERIQKLSQKVDEFNRVAIPKVLAEVEMTKRKIDQETEIINTRIESMVAFEEFEKFGRSLKFEIDKVFQNFKILSENSEKVEEYLDHYLPLENWGMISEAIASLDAKILKGFYDFDKQKFDTLKMDIEFDYLDIDGLSKRALDAYDEGIKRRETMLEKIKAALKKEKKQNKKMVKNLKVNTKDTRRKVEPDRTKVIEQDKKISVEDGGNGNKVSEEGQNVVEIDNKPVTLQHNFVPSRKYSINKIEEYAGDEKNRQEDDLVFSQAIEDTVRSPTIIQPPDRDPIRENLSLPSPIKVMKPEKSHSRKSILEIENTIANIYFPVSSSKSSLKSSRKNSVINPKKVSSSRSSSDDDSPLDIYQKFSQATSPSIDPAKLEKDLESLRQSIETLESKSSNLLETTQKTSESVNLTLSQFSQDLSSNFALIHNEIKQLIQKNKQSRVDVSKTLTDFSKDMREREKTIERVDQQFGNVSELLANIVEFCKVIHSILAQEEEDRENLNLIGIYENKPTQKGYLSLKTECMSCSGNNTVVMSAFKMACINYNPSPIKYCLKNFTRKQLIHVLGTFISESWRAATAKPPYDRVPPPTMSGISLTTDNTRRRNRYSRSQYLELPSLNTSKQYLDLNDTSIHSFREYKQ